MFMLLSGVCIFIDWFPNEFIPEALELWAWFRMAEFCPGRLDPRPVVPWLRGGCWNKFCMAVWGW